MGQLENFYRWFVGSIYQFAVPIFIAAVVSICIQAWRLHDLDSKPVRLVSANLVEDCGDDIMCKFFGWDLHQQALQTAMNCLSKVEVLAGPDIAWMNEFNGHRWNPHPTLLANGRIATVIGDRLLIRDKHGIWDQVEYMCQFDLKTREVLDWDIGTRGTFITTGNPYEDS